MSKFVLVPGEFVMGMMRQLNLRIEQIEKETGMKAPQDHGPGAYVVWLEKAPEIELPSIYIGKTSNRRIYLTVAHTMEHARRIFREPWITQPVTVEELSIAHPDLAGIVDITDLNAEEPEV